MVRNLNLPILIFLIVFISGCGVTGSLRNPEDTDFVMVSSSQAGGVWKVIRGQTTICKMTKHGVDELQYEIESSDGSCKVKAMK